VGRPEHRRILDHSDGTKAHGMPRPHHGPASPRRGNPRHSPLFRFSGVPPHYLPTVLIVSVSDTLSALVDRKYGNHHVLGMHNRTLEGSFAFFSSALVNLLLTCPARVALSATFFVSLIEFFPFYNLDNLLVPVETALFLKFARGMLKKTSLLDITRGERSFYYFYGKIKLDKYLETATNADSEIASPNISSSYPCIQPQREIHASIETHRRFHHVHYCSTPTKCKLS